VNFMANFETIIILYYNIFAGHCGCVCRASLSLPPGRALRFTNKKEIKSHVVHGVITMTQITMTMIFNHLFQEAESSASIQYWFSYMANRTSGIPETLTTAVCWRATRNWSWSRWTTGSAYWVSWTKNFTIRNHQNRRHFHAAFMCLNWVQLIILIPLNWVRMDKIS